MECKAELNSDLNRIYNRKQQILNFQFETRPPFIQLYTLMIYSPVVSLKSKSTLSDDGTYIMMCDHENDHLQNFICDVFAKLNKCFKLNKLTLNFSKAICMKIAANNKICII